MASCPKCSGTTFSLTDTVPTGSQFKICLVQCNGCGAAVGALEKETVGVLVYHLAAAVDRLATKLGVDSGLPAGMRSRH